MPKTVSASFKEFNDNHVNLDPNRTKNARLSRDWLWGQLCRLETIEELSFPLAYGVKHIKFGSFARNTKIRPLDDIDLMFCLTANGATYTEYTSTYVINTPNAGERLRSLSDNNILNSRRVVNKFVSALSNIGHYKNAELHRTGEAATLQLASYEWNFDIVPCFYTDTELYLIPDGNGNWKATDPRIDQERVTSANKVANGNLLQLIRTLKYWNRHHSSYGIGSYLFEQILINYASYVGYNLSDFSNNIKVFFSYLSRVIFYEILDPKGIQGNLNEFSLEQRRAISAKSKQTHEKAIRALNAELNLDHKTAINIWREIFGDKFPRYE